jgi:hypothetical protein
MRTLRSVPTADLREMARFLGQSGDHEGRDNVRMEVARRHMKREAKAMAREREQDALMERVNADAHTSVGAALLRAIMRQKEGK